jgi:hypothetical protein
MLAARKLRWRNSRKASIGSFTRPSIHTNTASTTTPATSGIRVSGLVQPCCCPWLRPNTSAAIPMLNVTTPG